MYESMWYRGSRGDDENIRRIIGASFARSVGDHKSTLLVNGEKRENLL